MLALAPRLGAKELLSLDKAQALLFPRATKFEPHFVALDAGLKERLTKASGTKVRGDEQKVWRALDAKGKSLGWFLVDEVLGKHEYFDYAAALSPEGAVLRVEILTYSETHGGQVQRRDWLRQFEGKRPGDRVELMHGIDGISGATLSCKHVTDGMRRLLAFYDLALRSQSPAVP
jgi:hypothetical protein